ncbi:MAG: hypothetical protein V2I41_08370, partial [Pseudomonadales bacterium]|nr:hypothetical protein [Pseudomonadales bacterium]
MTLKPMSLEKVAIVGVGLIGGSLGAAWRAASFARHIVGVETNPVAAKLALELELVDEICANVPPDADLIAICTPSDRVAEQVNAL